MSAATCDCGHPQGWHRKNVGACIECGCTYFDDRDEAAVDWSVAKKLLSEELIEERREEQRRENEQDAATASPRCETSTDGARWPSGGGDAT